MNWRKYSLFDIDENIDMTQMQVPLIEMVFFCKKKTKQKKPKVFVGNLFGIFFKRKIKSRAVKTNKHNLQKPFQIILVTSFQSCNYL